MRSMEGQGRTVQDVEAKMDPSQLLSSLTDDGRGQLNGSSSRLPEPPELPQAIGHHSDVTTEEEQPSRKTSELMSGVLSPETARRLYEVTERNRNRSSKSAEVEAEQKLTTLQVLKQGDLGNKNIETHRNSSNGPLENVLSPETSRRLYSMQIAESSEVTISAPDDAELDAWVSGDPCVLAYGDRVVLRSSKGPCLAVCKTMEGDHKNENLASSRQERSSSINSMASLPSWRLNVNVNGNSVELNSAYVVVNATLRSKTGPVKFGDSISLLSTSAGRYLGVFDDGDGDYQIDVRRKAVGRHETWVIIEGESKCYDRAHERKLRVEAANSRIDKRAKELGYHIRGATVQVNKTQTSVRSSDQVALQSRFAQGLTLAADLTLVRGEPEFWSIVKMPSPFLPAWSRERPLLNGIVLTGNKENANSASTPGGLWEQEQTLVEELLYAMQGIQGDFVRCDIVEKEVWFVKGPRMDPALTRLARRITPLCTNYLNTIRFVIRRSRAEHGKVAHATTAAMRSLLKEYDILIVQLEQQHEKNALTLGGLWYYIQPSMRTMEILSQVAKATEGCKGGALLNTLQELISNAGDSKSRQVLRYLLQEAAVPYLEMLELWIYHGVIRDPFDEFMIKVDEDATKRTLRDDFNARYWDARYTILPGNVPIFLQRVAEKVLTTGKYLNVVRECGRWVGNSFSSRIPYTDQDHIYEQIVSRAHAYASKTLLNLFIQEEQLLARLGSLKHYFLLDQGDFFVHFMDVAGDELQQPTSNIAVNRLQSLLEMCLRLRNVNDPFQEDLTCELVPYTLIEHVEAIHQFASTGADHQIVSTNAVVNQSGLRGVDAFTLDFKVRWPLSLVLSRQALTKYQLIFRHLFFCKHVERQLCFAWLSHQTTKELDLRRLLGPDYCLRQRMLLFVQNFQLYCMFEVLEPRWHQFQQKLRKAQTVDELMRHHSAFLDTCLRECLLTHQRLLKTLAKLLTTCSLFATQIARLTDQLYVDETSMTKQATLRQTRIKVQSQHMRRIVNQQSYRDIIQRSKTKFDSMLKSFLQALLEEAAHGEYHSHLTNLCTRLDYNSYWSTK